MQAGQTNMARSGRGEALPGCGESVVFVAAPRVDGKRESLKLQVKPSVIQSSDR